MDTTFLLVLLLLFAAMALAACRAASGPTWHDRVLAANAFTTKTILAIAVYLFAAGTPQYLDIAVLYALINYVGTLAFAAYCRRQVGDA